MYLNVEVRDFVSADNVNATCRGNSRFAKMFKYMWDLHGLMHLLLHEDRQANSVKG